MGCFITLGTKENNMDNSGIMPKIRLGMFQPSAHALTLDNIAIIDDNLELAPDDRNIGAPTEKPLPNKILAAIYMVCVEGEVELTLNQQNFHMKKDDLLVCTPGFIAEKVWMSKDCKIIIIATSNDSITKSPFKCSEAVRKWLMRQGGPAVLPLGDELCDLFVKNYQCFRTTYEYTNLEFRPEILISFMHTILALIASWLSKFGRHDEDANIPRKKEMIIKFLNDVHEYCGVERSVSFYAERCCLSPKYFARLVTESLGKKPGDIIKENVILEAKVMLISKSFSVQQVSDKLNFPNASFFCKYFKAATGCSPRRYQLYGEEGSRQE